MTDMTKNTRNILTINEADVIDMCMSRNGYVGDFEWTEEMVIENMRRFEKALEWGVMDAVWDVLTETALDIEIENEVEL